VSEYRILVGDCLDVLATLPERSVQTCITSPPYFGLRSYDDDAVRIDPTLNDGQRSWLIAELERRGIRASR
jgi:DNA modification methylase